MEEEIKILRDYFSHKPSVIVAILFGSKAKGISGKISDWDIAIYFKLENSYIEWEEIDRDYPEEDKIWAELSDLLRTNNIDLIILNRAPVNIAAQASKRRYSPYYQRLQDFY